MTSLQSAPVSSSNCLTSEFTLENMTSPAVSAYKINENDRTGDGNLLPEAKIKAKKAIEEHVHEAGRINVSELSRRLNLSRQTVRIIADEVLAEWYADIEDQTIVTHKWYENLAQEIDVHPDDFNKDTIPRLRFKMSLFDKMRAMRKILKKGK